MRILSFLALILLFLPSCTSLSSENKKRGFIKNLQIYVDSYEVTTDNFRTFIVSTGYTTTADSIGNGVFFDYSINTWKIVENANWEYPDGKNKANNNHPVTQISYKDACTYCKWKNGRLPTEKEWNTIAGNKLTSGNFWQGAFPWEDYGEDNYRVQTAPVGNYENAINGVYDLFGNVWEWTSSSRIDTTKNNFNNIPSTFAAKKQKLIKGGSFLCEPNSCGGYLPGRAQVTAINTTTNNLGFRCVYDK